MPINPATLVVGGGIAGISAALEIADAGFPVYLVEREPSIGGHMAQFDKTFPTLDCCGLHPDPQDGLGRQPPQHHAAHLERGDRGGRLRRQLHGDGPQEGALRQRRPVHRLRHLPGEVPEKVIDDVFEAGLGYRKAIYTPFPQAVPKYPVIDRDNCTYFEQGTCKACEKFCPTERHRLRPAGRDRRAPGRQHRPGHRLRPVRCPPHRAVRLRPPAQRLHQPGVRAPEQRRRPDQRQHRPARREDRRPRPSASSTASAAATATTTTTARPSAACRA